MKKQLVGIVGFGHVGQYLFNFIQTRENLEVGFVWNRTLQVLKESGVPPELILDNIEDFASRKCDLIVEVAHPEITRRYGTAFLKQANYMIGSPTALADEETELSLRELAAEGLYGVYIPVGALWGAEDVRRLANSGTLEAGEGFHELWSSTCVLDTRFQGLCISMTKHPAAFRLTGTLKELNEDALSRPDPTVLYNGGIRALCNLAPNNVNTMAVGAIAAHNLGFDKVRGVLIADPRAEGWHIITVEALGSTQANGNQFIVSSTRKNPAEPGSVTGSATYASFASSLLSAHGKGPGFHIC